MAAIAAQARSRPGVIEATGRTQFDGDVEVDGRTRDIRLQVFVAAPDDPMRMARFDLRRPGVWPPSGGEILLARDSLDLLDVAVGDAVTVTAPGGRRLRLRAAGTVYDPSLSPSPQEQRGRAYLSTTALAAVGAASGLDQLKIQVADPGRAGGPGQAPGGGRPAPSRDRDTVAAVAGDVGQWLRREKGLAIREVQVPPRYAHPHQWQADALLGSLLAAGFVALLLAAILVATMLNGLFTQQIPQIGIMKAIGARAAHVGRLYVAMTLLVAAAATLLALPAAALGGRVQVERFVGLLGVEPASLAAPWWTYAVILAAGLGLPPLLALSPLVKASRTTVRAPIDHHGLGSRPGAAAAALTRLSRIHRLDRGLLLALRNTMRRPARFWLSVGLLAGAGTVFVAGLSLAAGVQAVDEERTRLRYWDVDVHLASPAAVDEVTAAVRRVPGVTRVEAWHVAATGVAGPGRLPLTRTYPDQGHGRISVGAIPPGISLAAQPRLLEGRWLKPAETGAVVINQTTRANAVQGVGAGDTVQLFLGGRPTSWRVVGIVEEKRGDGPGVYSTAEGLAAATGRPQRANELRVITDRHDEPTRRAVAAAVDAALTGAKIDVESATSVSHLEAISAGHLGPIVFILLGVVVPLGVVGGIGLASTMSANVLDRTREFGVMHAIGARPRTVRRIVVAEGVFWPSPAASSRPSLR
jgi:putative ABC transport system permease protein